MSQPLTSVADGARHRVLEAGDFALTDARYPGGRTLPSHAHGRPVLTFILRGSVQERCVASGSTCEALGVVAIPAGEPHAERFPGTGAHCLIVEVAETRAAAIRDCSPLLDAPSYTRGADVAGLTQRLHREFRDADDVAPLAIEGLVLQLAALASRRRGGPREAAAPRWLSRVRDALHAGFAGSPTIADLAADAAVHPVHLARAFREHYRCSPSEYLRRLRVDAAAELLAASDLPIARIAARVGYADQSHLTRQFKRATGLTPGAYRSAAAG